jgi:hypothetical protein
MGDFEEKQSRLEAMKEDDISDWGVINKQVAIQNLLR